MRLQDLFETANYDLQKKYDFFNAELFNGELPKVPLHWKPLKGIGGRVTGKPALPPPPGWRKPSPVEVRLGADPLQGLQINWDTVKLDMSTVFKRSEDEINGILVHEMIHLWMWSQGRLKESHGPTFMRKLKELQAKVTFTIPVTEDITNKELADDSQITPVGVAWGRKKNGDIIYMMIGEKLARQSAEAMREEWSKEVMGDYPLFTEAKLVIAKNPTWSLHAAKRTIGRIAVKGVKPSKKYGTTRVWPTRYVLSPELAAKLIPALEDAEVLWELRA